MAAFDLNSLYFLKNAAPKTASFEEVAAPIKTGFDLGRAYNENYNKNSLQNLIAQRESEGVPFDRLSNEAAKWDLNAAANVMRPEARKSIDFNFKQSAVEFDRWRKEMARRICGLILQKSDELGMAPDQQYGVLDTAAHYVVTYDPELAEFLMQQANTRRYNAARTAPKMQNQDESKLYPSEISSRKAKANDVDFAGANRFLGTYQNNSANVGAMLANLYSTGKLPYLKKAWIDGVTQFAMNSDPSTFRNNSIWDNETVSKAIELFMNGGMAEQQAYTVIEQAPVSAQSIPAKAPFASNVNLPKNDDYTKSIRSYYIPGNAARGTRENLNVSRIDSDLKKYYDNLEALQYMVGVLSQDNQRFAGVKGDAGANSENGVVKVNREKVQKRIDELKELERGGFTPETAKALKLSGKTGQTLSDEIARWQRIPKIIDAYYANPGAILPPLVRTLLPEERTTDEDVKRIIKSDLGEDGYNKLFNAIAATDKNILGSLLSKEAYANAVRKVAPIIMNNMKKEYNALVKANNGDSGRVDNALREAYRYDDDVIDYVKGNKILFTVKKYYDKEAERVKNEREKKEKEVFEQTAGKNKVMSASEWLKRRREGK